MGHETETDRPPDSVGIGQAEVKCTPLSTFCQKDGFFSGDAPCGCENLNSNEVTSVTSHMIKPFLPFSEDVCLSINNCIQSQPNCDLRNSCSAFEITQPIMFL